MNIMYFQFKIIFSSRKLAADTREILRLFPEGSYFLWIHYPKGIRVVECNSFAASSFDRRIFILLSDDIKRSRSIGQYSFRASIVAFFGGLCR